MSLVEASGRHVHYPENPTKFVFDAEVSAHFGEMAQRSIPGYAEAHRLHVSLLRDILNQDKVSICDIGASRGSFFREICNQFQIPVSEGSPRFDFTATDNSPHMLALLEDEMPWVRTLVIDAQNMPELDEPLDIVCLFYVLQFIETTEDKLKVLRWAYRNLRPGGVLLLGQKEATHFTFAEAFTREYIDFRKANGYSQEEIDAKTRALQNSMWPSTAVWLEEMCYFVRFYDYVETSKWLMFSTSMCVR